MLHTHTVKPATLELLKLIEADKAFQPFFLVGGTNLSLRYGHRLSIDLDFFTDVIFESEDVYQLLVDRGFTDLQIINQTQHSLLILIDDVRVDFILHKYPIIAPTQIIDGIKMASIPDVAAMKINAITKRGAKKDFYDVAELLNHYDLEQLLKFYSEKYSNHDLGFVLRSLVYFEDAEPQPVPIAPKGQTWDKAKEVLKASVKAYF